MPSRAQGSAGEPAGAAPQQAPGTGLPGRVLRAPRGTPGAEAGSAGDPGSSRGRRQTPAPRVDRSAAEPPAGRKRQRSGTPPPPPPGTTGEKPGPKTRRAEPREARAAPAPAATERSQRVAGRRKAPEPDLPPRAAEPPPEGARGTDAGAPESKGRPLRARRPDSAAGAAPSPAPAGGGHAEDQEPRPRRPLRRAAPPLRPEGPAPAGVEGRASPRRLRSGRRDRGPSPAEAEQRAGDEAVADKRPLRPRRRAPGAEAEPSASRPRAAKRPAQEAAEDGGDSGARETRSRSRRGPDVR